jgi:hypothetical protein
MDMVSNLEFYRMNMLQGAISFKSIRSRRVELNYDRLTAAAPLCALFFLSVKDTAVLEFPPCGHNTIWLISQQLRPENLQKHYL